MLMMKHAGQFNKASLDAADEPERDGRDNNCSPDISSDGLKNVNSEDGLVTKVCQGGGGGQPADDSGQDDLDVEEYILQGGAMPKHSVELREKPDPLIAAEERRLIQQLSKDEYDEDYLLQKVSMLQVRLDDAQKTIQIERDEKNVIHKNFEKFRQDMQELREKCEELRAAKQDAVRELLTLQEQHRVEMRITNNSLQEEVAARETLERRLCELRTEVRHQHQLFYSRSYKLTSLCSSSACRRRTRPSGASASAWKRKSSTWSARTRSCGRSAPICRNASSAKGGHR